MKIVDHIAKAAGKTLFSFELLPPLKGQGIETIFNTIDPLMEFNPPFIDVTYHREDYIYKQQANGLLQKIAYRKRPGTIAICAAIMHKYNVDAVPHLICGGFTKEETENALIDLHFLGIDNILALRGDARKAESQFIPTEGGHRYAADLIEQIDNMNKGIYLHENLDNISKTNFCIGVAGYPEKHFECPNLSTDLKHLKHKMDKGGQFIVTQMFFDNKKYFDFVDACKKAGIANPIVIPGLKPLTSKKQLVNIPKSFFIDIPEDLTNAILNTKTDKEAEQVGIEWTIQQCKELKKRGAPVLHFYTMGKPHIVHQIAKAVF